MNKDDDDDDDDGLQKFHSELFPVSPAHSLLTANAVSWERHSSVETVNCSAVQSYWRGRRLGQNLRHAAAAAAVPRYVTAAFHHAPVDITSQSLHHIPRPFTTRHGVQVHHPARPGLVRCIRATTWYWPQITSCVVNASLLFHVSRRCRILPQLTSHWTSDGDVCQRRDWTSADEGGQDWEAKTERNQV